jgi:hypothetical protein
LRFKSVIQRSAYGVWKWELYLEGEGDPISVGFSIGDQDEVDAAILPAKRFALEQLEKSANGLMRELAMLGAPNGLEAG